MADDITDCKNGKEDEKQFLLLINDLKRIRFKDGEIGAKAEKKDSLRDKGIVIGYKPPNGNDYQECLSCIPYYIIKEWRK
jgi:hypothetical protein